MRIANRFIGGAIRGAFTAIPLIFIACLLAAASSWIFKVSVVLPGIFRTTPGYFQSSASVDFVPNTAGMLTVVVFGAFLGALSPILRRAIQTQRTPGLQRT